MSEALLNEEISVDEYGLIESICKESFYEFVKEFWDTIIPEEPVWNWHIKYLCDELQRVAERVFKGIPKKYDLIINVPPGSTKSTIGSVMYPAWVWTRMQRATVIGGSYEKTLALDLALRNRDIVMSDKYMNAFPYVRIRPDQSAKSEFMNTKRGKRIAVGTGGSIIGRHADIIVVDDPLDPKAAASEAELYTANKWISGTLSTRKKDKAITPTILIMQRLHQADPTADMRKRAKEAAKLSGGKAKIKWICLPAEASDKIRPKRLIKYYKRGKLGQNALLDPIRLNMTTLNENKAEGSYFYASQFMQWPVPLEGGMFKIDRLKYGLEPTHWKKRIRFWDYAATGTGKNLKKAAWTVGAEIGLCENNKWWVIDIKRVKLDTAEREDLIMNTARRDGRNIIIGIEQEPGSGGKAQVDNTIRMLAGYSVRVDRPTGDKATRADPFSVQVNQGNVWLVEAAWNKNFVSELEFFPNSEFKDQVDASSGGFNILAGGMLRAGGLW